MTATSSPKPIERLTPLDRLMLWASRRWPQDVCALIVLDGAPLLGDDGQLRLARLRETIEGRLHLAPRLRQLIHHPARGLGGPIWVDAPAFDIAHHVRELRLEPPTGEAELLAAAEHILGRRLDPARPLWEMWFLTGLPGQRVALFVRIHHAIGDGIATMAMVASLCDPPPGRPAPVAAAWHPRPIPSGRALLADNLVRRLRGLAHVLSAVLRPRTTLRRIRDAAPAVREILAEEPATATSIDREVGPHRRLALIRTSLAAVRRVGRAHDGTVNDVLLAVTAAALRALLQHRGEPVDDTTLRIYVPVSLRQRLRGAQQGNRIAQMTVPLRMGESDPHRRLHDIASETTRRKARTRTSLDSLPLRGPLGRLALVAVMRQRVNATSASIPGPRTPLHLAGARAIEVIPIVPLVANGTVGVCALSYAGELTIGIAVDRDAYPDLEVLVGAMRAELRALGLPTFEGPAEPAVSSVPTPSPRPALRPG
jgi:WS/DGAT/MGAT family acyltransferase